LSKYLQYAQKYPSSGVAYFLIKDENADKAIIFDINRKLITALLLVSERHYRHVLCADLLRVAFVAVLRIRIRIHRIHMILGLPDPDPLVRGMDPDPALDPDPSIIMQK
jgi:hypothetical protein